MEPEAPIIQPMQPMQHSGKGKNVLVGALVAILLAGGVGGGVYYYMHKQAKDTKAKTDSQIQTLQKQVSDLKEAASWQTYTNSTYGFSFKYPAGWTVSEQKISAGDARQYEISFGDKGYYVTVFNIGSQTADAFVESFYGGVESGPSDIKDVKINNYAVVNFFMQKASTSSQTMGSTNYFFSKSTTGVDIGNSPKAKGASDTTLTKIVNSFAFQ
jgi:hypothetical protein